MKALRLVAAVNAGNNLNRLYDIARGKASIATDSTGNWIRGKKGYRIIPIPIVQQDIGLVRIEALVVDIFGNQSGTGNDVVRILASERDHAEGIGALLHEIARPGISVAVITPLTIHERDLLETAATQRWDLAILMLNNIMYTKGRLPLEKMIANAGELVRTMHRLFNKPIICFSGIDGSMRRAVMEAGSVCFVPMPPSPDVLKELKQTFKRHLAIWC